MWDGLVNFKVGWNFLSAIPKVRLGPSIFQASSREKLFYFVTSCKIVNMLIKGNIRCKLREINKNKGKFRDIVMLN
jgi:hypothetical protein